MNSAYEDRRKSLEAQYQAQKEAREIEKQRQEQVYDAQMQALGRDREEASRDAYVRQQQQLNALPEQLSAYGINGGAAETSLLKIHTQYNKARDQIRSDYESSAGAVRKSQRDLESKYAAGMAADRAEHYERLAKLAADIAQAREEEKARQEKLALEREKLALEERIEMAKLANKKTNSVQGGGTASASKPNAGDKTNQGTIKDEGSVEKAKQVTVATLQGKQTLSRIGNELYANKVVYDGSGSYYIVVDGQKMTPAQLNQAMQQNKIYREEGPMGSTLYRLKGSTIVNSNGSGTSITQQNRGGTFSLLKSLRG